MRRVRTTDWVVAVNDDLEQSWIPFLREVITRGYASHVGIVKDEEGGNFLRRSLKVGASVPARDLQPQPLAILDDDEVLMVTR